MSDFNQTSTVHIVRISPKQQVASNDYRTLLDEIERGKEPIWDKDSHNRIKPSDYLGFIVGKKGMEHVYVHKVLRDGPTLERHATWNENSPYSKGNGTAPVSHRETIYLSRDYHIYPWSWWKTAGSEKPYAPNCTSWMPRGTTKSRNPLK